MQNQLKTTAAELPEMCACDFIRSHEYDLTENIRVFCVTKQFPYVHEICWCNFPDFALV